MSNATEPLSLEYINAYKGDQLVAVAVAFIPVLFIVVALRFYCRHLSPSKFGADDFFVLLALFCQIGSSILSICGVKLAGSGYHLAALAATRPYMIERFFKWLLVDSFWYFLTVGIPKLAILAFYLRIFTLKAYRYSVYALAGIVLATMIVTSIVSLNLCRPFAFNWDHSIEGGSCYKQTVFFEWGSFPNIVTDVAILILPMPVVWNLHTNMRMKVGLTLTFILAGIGLAASIIRFDSFFHGDAIADGTWTVALPIWTMVEPNIYLIAACLVTYNPLLHKFRAVTGRITKTAFSRSGKSNPSNPSQKSSSTGEGTKNIATANTSNSRKMFRGRRKMGRGDLESLGNTFDMQDTVNDTGAEAH
ncbi:hypothetical protein HYFRA_00010299, partial [Hymenoscyphus fraxineus]